MRFAGSAVDFTPSPSGVSTGSYSGAASAVDLGTSFGSMRDKAPRFDQLSAEAMKNAAAERISAMDAEANVTSAGMTAYGQAYGQKLNAEGRIKAAKAQADAAKQGSMIGGIGGIIGTGLKLFTGGLGGGIGAGVAAAAGKGAATKGIGGMM